MRWIATIISIAMIGGVIWVIDDLLTRVHVADVLTEFTSLPIKNIIAALGLTALSYLMLILYDAMGLRHVSRALPLSRVALTSFASYVFAHNIGFGVITGGAVRYRLYGAAGLSAVEVATVSLFCGVTFAAGIAVMGGVTLLAEPTAVLSTISNLPVWLGRALGLGLIAAVGGYLVCCAVLREHIDVRGVEFRFPTLQIALGQLGVSAIDITVAALAMYMLMPQLTEISPWAFLGAYVLAILAGAISHLPGGLGVIEVAMVLLLPNQPPETVLAGALAYRVVYYLVPLGLATAMIIGAEIAERSELVLSIGRSLGSVLIRLAPQISGIFVLLAGAVLLISGVSPASEARLGPLTQILPLPLVEASHLLASVVGVVLLFLARGLLRRLDAAYYIAIAALGAGIVLSLLKGLDYEEAIILGLVLALVAASRKAFYRQTPLLTAPFTPGWIATVAVIVAASAWFGFFAYRHVEYSHDLWWTFATDADAPRFLRAQLLVTVFALAIGLYQALRPTRPLPVHPSSEDLESVRSVIAKVRPTEANLALLGDKQLLFNDKRDGFVMYGAQGGSLIALGDPIAVSTDARIELAWSFRELCDDHDRRTVFYQVSEDNLPLYIDMGLSLQKLGDEAIIPLAEFSLEGAMRRELRQAHARAIRDGLSFEVVPSDALNAVLADLKTVSDAWLSEKSTREKGFSIGSFSPDYISNFPCAVVRAANTDGSRRTVAFANLWLGGGKEEVSVDLMRHIEDAPHGVMDFLFVEIMLWGRVNGYRWFNLGLAPLSGLENHSLAPVWHRAGAFIFRHGENFYNFEGLRRYKAKFKPEWRPKYLATRGGLNIAAALFDVSTLISGGLRGLVAK
ncbi:MAG: bifunctional lysylphosphatidylglycerol flippase/synthetase MprF [Rhodospirillaceae bacterium]|nr:bifunctional lysylphosphatidylglycerol flippase/synthetase MprF [Rhodospirillaceae bacterium]